MRGSIRVIFASIIIASTLSAAHYTLQLGAFDNSRPDRAKRYAQELVEEATRAGIRTVMKVRRTKGGSYLVVETPPAERISALREVRKKAAKAGLEGFIRRVSETGISRPVTPVPPAPPPVPKLKERVQTQPGEDLSHHFFGENPGFCEIIEEGLQVRQEMRRQKQRFLKSYERSVSGSPLEARIKLERAVAAERDGADVGLSWNILDGGLFGSKARDRKRVSRSLAYEKEIERIGNDYMKMAQIEIDQIKKTIAYYYTVQQVRVLEKMVGRMRRALASGRVTQDGYDTLANLLDQKRRTLGYLRYQNFERFDTRYRKLIEKIEHIGLLDLDTLTQVAFQQLSAREKAERRYLRMTADEGVLDRIKAGLFIDRKQYTFIPRRETLAGIDIRVPLDLPGKGKAYAKLAEEHLARRQRSARTLLRKELESLYMDVAYRKNEIRKLHKSVSLLQRRLERLLYKVRVPVPGERGGQLRSEAMETRLKILEVRQRIWEFRADILRDLIALQYTGGVKIL